MSQFLRLLSETDKAQALLTTCTNLRRGEPEARNFDVAPESFDAVPGKPFAYWVSDAVRSLFQKLPQFESNGRQAQVGASTKDDFRFLRLYWESRSDYSQWSPFAKGGAYSRYYFDVHLQINWRNDGAEIESLVIQRYPYLNGNAEWVMHRESNYRSPGLTWPTRTTSGLGFRVLPSGCVFSVKGSAAFIVGNSPNALFALLAVTTSAPFTSLVELQLAAADAAARAYEVGVIQKTPMPVTNAEDEAQLAALARRAWSLKRTLDTIIETSHAFLLPAALRPSLGDYDPTAIESELVQIQTKIDALAFDLYDFAETDRQAVMGPMGDAGAADANEDEEEDSEADVLFTDALLSWAVGVAFGRFDWRLATGERQAPSEPDPFDPLPAKSPGMLPDGAAPFHTHAGILVDDQGHPHDLAHLIEEVLGRVDMPVPDDVRRWLQRDFFAFHLQRYSKSRRKAPIYWPLATASGSYTLWVYYPSLSSQTLYTAINDFVEPKLKQVGDEVAALRNKGAARSRDDEKQFEILQAFELELIELRDTLLKIAQGYQPNHDDGVQITAEPLWPLFRHKPWQKILKDTWTRLEKGDYDWAHLAMSYWPARVREKCKTDKSLAIAHDLEELYVEPAVKLKKTRGQSKKS